ncbi:MAG: biliverdin-producing heme oxygenase [Leptospiraceae bacterium]|nr:biliverdin-producing heme oxygenase [Leptospiraceae bacterium]
MHLSQILREGTASEHTRAEGARFIQAMFKGEIPKKAYIRQLEEFYHIYTVLENVLEKNQTHPKIKGIYFPELKRKDSLASDVIFFGGSLQNKTLSATINYMEHLEKISKESPELLVAHSYVRYLGDLSGGLILGKIIRRSYLLENGQGDAFYQFPISDPNSFKNDYRKALDEIPLTDEEKTNVLEEARKSFDLNGKLFMELEQYL